MNHHDLISDFPDGPGNARANLLYARLLLSYLADHVYTAELAAGGKLHDAMDFTAWLRELSDEARKLAQIPESTKVSAAAGNGTCRTVTRASSVNPQPRWAADFCPDCGHVHIDDTECGFPTGAGGREPCRCERKVPA
jgi:hypothetical protein